ncbi:hypothetical protein GH714_009974 [Hevea brasiliensis]|uniref:Uncharacterized protein n=1 Tax=Hevea brasiliensis TaxID=3981 RepID=A0A6A6KIA3_HEVBR|nr:hypothetical protein GH714_009974 [Hevea brasiliensis]
MSGRVNMSGAIWLSGDGSKSIIRGALDCGLGGDGGFCREAVGLCKDTCGDVGVTFGLMGVEAFVVDDVIVDGTCCMGE